MAKPSHRPRPRGAKSSPVRDSGSHPEPRRPTGPVTADLTIPRRVRSARLGFHSDSELADYLDVDKSRITRWRKGERPEPEVLNRLIGLEAVVALLQTWLAPTVVADWLGGVNAQLGHT